MKKESSSNKSCEKQNETEKKEFVPEKKIYSRPKLTKKSVKGYSYPIS